MSISDTVAEEQITLEVIARIVANDSQKLDYLLTEVTVAKEQGFIAIGLIQPDGTMYMTDGTILDVSSENYFRVAMNRETFVSDPFISSFGSFAEVLVRISYVPLLINNNSVGGLLLVQDGYSFSDFLINLSQNVTGSGVVFSLKTGSTVGHLTRSMVGSNFIEMAKTEPVLDGLASVPLALMRGETGIAEYTSSSGRGRIGFYEPIPGTP